MSKEKLKQNANPVGAYCIRPHFEGMAKKENGITLIALVITIIVMLILVGVSVTVALNGGLFSTAKEAAEGTATKRNEELNLSDGKVEINGEWYNSIDEYVNNNEETTLKLPEGATYKPAIAYEPDSDMAGYADCEFIYGETLQAGDNFPETVNYGDIYTYGDYEYCYGCYMSAGWQYSVDEGFYEGWGVAFAADGDLGPILSEINGKPVNNMFNIWDYGNEEVTSIEFIPNTITRGQYVTSYGNLRSVTFGGTMAEFNEKWSTSGTRICCSL